MYFFLLMNHYTKLQLMNLVFLRTRYFISVSNLGIFKTVDSLRKLKIFLNL